MVRPFLNEPWLCVSVAAMLLCSANVRTHANNLLVACRLYLPAMSLVHECMNVTVKQKIHWYTKLFTRGMAHTHAVRPLATGKPSVEQTRRFFGKSQHDIESYQLHESGILPSNQEPKTEPHGFKQVAS